MLWGAGSALRSGTLEALVYEELSHAGASAAFPRLLGRSRALSTLAEVTATLLAVPVLAAGGFRAAGIASVLACAAGVLVARTFPENRGAARGAGEGTGGHGGAAGAAGSVERGEAGTADEAEEEPGFRAVLRQGVNELRTSRPARRAVLLVSVLTGSLAYDEYIPLLAASTGVSTATVPLLVVPASCGAAVGNWYAGRGRSRVAPALALAAGFLTAGALCGHPAGLALVAAGYGLCTWASTTAEARLQDHLADRTRATVGSMAGVGSEVVSVGFFGAYALGSQWYGPGPLLALAAVPYVAASLALRRRTRNRR